MERVSRIAVVPDERKRAAGTEDAVDLGRSLLDPKPVKGRGGHDRVYRAALQRDRLGCCVEHLDFRHGSLELGAHPFQRFDRNHPHTGGDELAGQLARAGAKVYDRSPRTKPEAPSKPVDRGRRVIGPRAVVQLPDRPEAARRDRMNPVGYDGVTR